VIKLDVVSNWWKWIRAGEGSREGSLLQGCNKLSSLWK